ncbi:MAG: hypothetical protein AAFN74_27300, partial [Myxococcota bacterium]
MARKHGPQLERLDAVAASNGLIAVGGHRDVSSIEATQVHIFDRRGELKTSVDFETSIVALAFILEDILVAGTSDGRLIGCAVTGSTSKSLFDVSVHQGAVRALCTDALRRRLWSVGDDGMLASFDVQGAKLEPSGAPVRASDSPLYALAVDREGRRLATAGADGQARIFTTAAIAEGPQRTTPIGEGELFSLAFADDGRLVAGGGDGSIRIVYVEGAPDEQDRTGDQAHKGAVRGLMFGPALVDANDKPKPRRLFSIADDGELRAW